MECIPQAAVEMIAWSQFIQISNWRIKMQMNDNVQCSRQVSGFCSLRQDVRAQCERFNNRLRLTAPHAQCIETWNIWVNPYHTKKSQTVLHLDYKYSKNLSKDERRGKNIWLDDLEILTAKIFSVWHVGLRSMHEYFCKSLHRRFYIRTFIQLGQYTSKDTHFVASTSPVEDGNRVTR